MILNANIPDRSRLKVLILSCPKTGNTWLRMLVHYAYRLPIAELPRQWSDEHARTLPDAFVAHQHFWPSEALLGWLRANDAVVLTTIRHPADTLLSYFHFGKWNDLPDDRLATAMKKDGDTPGANALEFAKYTFAQAYAMSLAWARLGARVVRYEDLLADPVRVLRELADAILPLEEYQVAHAAYLCKPEQMTDPGLVDPRHLRTATGRGWVREIPAALTDVMARIEPYRSACLEYGYGWDREAPAPRSFDYATIDPFRGARYFDNGEPLGSSLVRVYLHPASPGASRWPDPVATAGDSFWSWLRAPSDDAALDPSFAPATFTNLMQMVHHIRPDLQRTYPDPARADRAAFLTWFAGQAPVEFRFPWALLAPPVEAYCDYLGLQAR